MRSKSSKPADLLPRWRVYRIRKSPAEFLGTVHAKDEATAIARALEGAYSTATIAADRGQRSFRLSLDQFLAKRGGAAIVARGRALKQSHAALFASIQQRYGVPPGPLLAISICAQLARGYFSRCPKVRIAELDLC